MNIKHFVTMCMVVIIHITTCDHGNAVCYCYVCQNYVFYLFDIFMSCTIPRFFSFEINLVSSAILEVLL